MHKYTCKIYQCLRNYTGCQFGMKYLRIYNVFCQYIKFSCSVRNTHEMYAVPSSIYLVYNSLVFCISSLIQIMGKQNLNLSRQKRSYIKKRRSHTVRLTPAKRLKTVIPSTPSQTLHTCLASIPQGTPSKISTPI